MNPEAWEETSLFDPDAPGAEDRRALLEYLTRAGRHAWSRWSRRTASESFPAVAGDLVMGTDRASVC